jgi:hypothetical protein
MLVVVPVQDSGMWMLFLKIFCVCSDFKLVGFGMLLTTGRALFWRTGYYNGSCDACRHSRAGVALVLSSGKTISVCGADDISDCWRFV